MIRDAFIAAGGAVTTAVVYVAAKAREDHIVRRENHRKDEGAGAESFARLTLDWSAREVELWRADAKAAKAEAESARRRGDILMARIDEMARRLDDLQTRIDEKDRDLDDERRARAEEQRARVHCQEVLRATEINVTRLAEGMRKLGVALPKLIEIDCPPPPG